MSRPFHSALVRLQRKVWSRRLRIQRSQHPKYGSDAANWTSLERALLRQHPIAKTYLRFMDRPQTLIGVADKGKDPRGVRRILITNHDALEAMDASAIWATPDQLPMSNRLPSGPHSSADQKTTQEYLEVPVDLVDCGEQLCPGSSEWDKNHLLWILAQPFLPPLDAIREELARLKWSLRLCTPSHQQRRALTNEPIPISFEAAAARYSASLEPLSQRIDVRVLSLLAGLVAESHIVGNETLLDIHKEHFTRAVELLLEHEWIEDLRKPFERLIRNRLLLCSWESGYQHPTSIYAPYIALEDWEQQTGISGWRGHDW